LKLISKAKGKGIKEKRTCELLQITSRRIRRWRNRNSLEDQKPGPKKAPHRLLDSEKRAILDMAKSDAFVDDTPRVLSAKAYDNNIVNASPASFYRVMRVKGLTTDRTGKKKRKGTRNKPDRPELTGPNQRWCWDISYLKTFIKGVFIYLYLVIDEYSRKAVSWRMSQNLSHEEGKELVQTALEKERLKSEQIEVLSLYNDRGAQMKAKEFMRMLDDLGITQKFSRPRTPNDNPFIESAFSIVKGESFYPGAFKDENDAIKYFTKYFQSYNFERLHGGIGFVTPDQRHRGVDKMILENRMKKKEEARINRLTSNRLPG